MDALSYLLGRAIGIASSVLHAFNRRQQKRAAPPFAATSCGTTFMSAARVSRNLAALSRQTHVYGTARVALL